MKLLFWHDEVCNATKILFLFQLGKNIVDYQNQAKRLFKTLTATSPIKCSIESGPYLFQ